MKKITLLFVSVLCMLSVANAQEILYSEDFESDLGWTSDQEATFAPSTLNGTWSGGVNLETAGDVNIRMRYGWSSTKLSLKTTDAAVTIPNINVAGYADLSLSIDLVIPGGATVPFIEASADGGDWVTLTTVAGGSWGVATQSIALPAANSTISLRINPPAAGDDQIFNDFVITGTADVSLATESNQLSDNSIKVYPNPFNDYVEVECAEIIKNVSIYSISGQIVDEVVANLLKVNIATNNLTKGIYMLKIETEKGSQTVKMVK